MSAEPGDEAVGLQVAGFILRVVSMLLCALPVFVLVTAAVGAVLSSIGLQKHLLRGLAIAGLVLSLLAAILNAIIYELFFFSDLIA